MSGCPGARSPRGTAQPCTAQPCTALANTAGTVSAFLGLPTGASTATTSSTTHLIHSARSAAVTAWPRGCAPPARTSPPSPACAPARSDWPPSPPPAPPSSQPRWPSCAPAPRTWTCGSRMHNHLRPAGFSPPVTSTSPSPSTTTTRPASQHRRPDTCWATSCCSCSLQTTASPTGPAPTWRTSPRSAGSPAAPAAARTWSTLQPAAGSSPTSATARTTTSSPRPSSPPASASRCSQP